MTLAPTSDRQPKLPGIPKVSPESMMRALEAMREIVEVREGRRPNQSVMDRFLTVRDLVDAKVIKVKSGAGVYNPVGTPGAPTPGTIQVINPEEDLSSPPAPTGLTAVGAMQNVILEWDDPAFSSPVYAYTEIWRASVDNLGSAVLVGTAIGSVATDPVGVTNATRYYWIRFISRANVAGPFNAVAGVSATLGFILTAHLADLLVTAQKLADASVEAVKIANLAVGSAAIANLAVGTAHVQDAAIVTAKIGLLAVDAARIADLAVTTAKMGDLSVTTAKIADAAITNLKVAMAAIGTANIQDAAVQTLKIAGQAVTIPIGAYTAAAIAIGESNLNGWTTVQSVTITSTGAPINIFTNTQIFLGSSGSLSSLYYLRLLRNGVSLVNYAIYTSPWNSFVQQPHLASFNYQDQPGAATWTYELQAMRNSNSANGHAANRFMLALETKR